MCVINDKKNNWKVESNRDVCVCVGCNMFDLWNKFNSVDSLWHDLFLCVGEMKLTSTQSSTFKLAASEGVEGKETKC